MTKHLLFFLGVFTITAGFSQKKTDPSVYGKTITAADLKKHLSVIASAEMEGRNTPSPGLEKAADYISKQFQSFGLMAGNKGSYRQTFQLEKDSLQQLTLNINGIDFTPYQDFAPVFVDADNLNLDYKEYVFAGFGIVDSNRDDYKNIDVKNKLVILLNGAPTSYTSEKTGREAPTYIMNKIANASKKGAAAVFVLRDPVPSQLKIPVVYRPSWTNESSEKQIPVFIIGNNVAQKVSGSGFDVIKKAVEDGNAPSEIKTATVKLRYTIKKEKATASNIIGVIEGSDKKDEYLFVTAHYDHIGKDAHGNIYYGADDDGSGTVSVIEMAKAFAKAKKEGHGPRRTIVFMTVSGEEKGLWGSEYYAEHPIFPLEKTTADLNIDMIGRTSKLYLNDKDSINYIYVVGDDKLSTDLTPITEAVNKKYTQLKLDSMYNDPRDPERIYYRSDHYNFARKGVPIIFYFDGMVNGDYHQPTDTIDKINFSLLSRRAQLVFYTAWEMANRNDMLKRDLKLPGAE